MTRRYCNRKTILVHMFGCKIKIKPNIFENLTYTIIFTLVVRFNYPQNLILLNLISLLNFQINKHIKIYQSNEKIDFWSFFFFFLIMAKIDVSSLTWH
jgi:hypothetical protein